MSLHRAARRMRIISSHDLGGQDFVMINARDEDSRLRGLLTGCRISFALDPLANRRRNDYRRVPRSSSYVRCLQHQEGRRALPWRCCRSIRSSAPPCYGPTTIDREPWLVHTPSPPRCVLVSTSPERLSRLGGLGLTKEFAEHEQLADARGRQHRVGAPAEFMLRASVVP